MWGLSFQTYDRSVRATVELNLTVPRFHDVFAKYLHPIAIVVTVKQALVQGVHELPHRQFVHERLEAVFERRWKRVPHLPPLFTRRRDIGWWGRSRK